MSELFSADAELVAVARSVITTAHPHLDGVPVAYLLRRPPAMRAGRPVLGSTRLATAAEQALLPDDKRPDVVVTLSADHWDTVSPDVREAIIDHELSHLRFDDEGQVCIVPHDIEEFSGVLQRRGAWWAGLAGSESADAAVAACAQLELPLDSSPKAKQAHVLLDRLMELA